MELWVYSLRKISNYNKSNNDDSDYNDDGHHLHYHWNDNQIANNNWIAWGVRIVRDDNKNTNDRIDNHYPNNHIVNNNGMA